MRVKKAGKRQSVAMGLLGRSYGIMVDATAMDRAGIERAPVMQEVSLITVEAVRPELCWLTAAQESRNVWNRNSLVYLSQEGCIALN